MKIVTEIRNDVLVLGLVTRPQEVLFNGTYRHREMRLSAELRPDPLGE